MRTLRGEVSLTDCLAALPARTAMGNTTRDYAFGALGRLEQLLA
jgi:hypothetical protein